MRFDTLSIMDHHPDAGRSVAGIYSEVLEQFEAAEALGFGTAWVAEHHFRPYGVCPAPPVLLAAAAQRTSRLRLGVAVSVLPFHNPLEVAEQYATLDIVSGGRLDLAVGRGYLAHEYEGYGLTYDQSAERFEEALTILEQAWSGGEVHLEGRHHRYGPLRINVQPVQQPRPPMWIAGLSPETYARAPRRGYPVMGVPYVLGDLNALAELLATFHTAAAEAGLAPEALEPGMAFHVHVGETDEQAVEEARPHLQRYVDTRAVGNTRSFDELQARDLVIVGGPDHCIAAIRRLQGWGVGRLLAIHNFGGFPHPGALASMERFARHVLPAF